MDNNNICNLRICNKIPKFEEIGSENFIWVPLKKVPIDEHYPINSMSQPALRMFPLLTWTAVAPLATEEQKYMQKLALEHEEMGYFLLHYKDIFGIIGVNEYRNGSKTAGRAVIFNSIEDNNKIHAAKYPVLLDLVYSELKYPLKYIWYSPGQFSDYNRIDYEDYCPESLED